MDFKDQLTKYTNRVNQELENYIQDKNCPEKILKEAMEYSLLAGGKRLRPILMLSTYQLFANDIQFCMPFAVALEMVHNFSLIHDDLPAIDDDDLRHGKLTNHKKYGEATAILAGDALLNQAYLVISSDIINEKNLEKKERKIQALHEFSIAVDRMIAGEYVDTEYEGKQISEEYLEYMHQNKTGALITLAVRIGAILAKADETNLERLTAYSKKIGLAFQMKDDILSEIGTEKELGKPVGNDKKKGKCTYVTKYGLKQSEIMLNNMIAQATEIMDCYKEKGEFLKGLASYIQYRNK